MWWGAWGQADRAGNDSPMSQAGSGEPCPLLCDSGRLALILPQMPWSIMAGKRGFGRESVAGGQCKGRVKFSCLSSLDPCEPGSCSCQGAASTSVQLFPPTLHPWEARGPCHGVLLIPQLGGGGGGEAGKSRRS